MVSVVRGAISESAVLVLYNVDCAEGIEIAAYYAQLHPNVHTLGLTGVTTAEDVTAEYYLEFIRPQILSALNSSINVIVTTKGLPLRIYNGMTNPGTYVDPDGVTRTVSSTRWKAYSSLESELTRIEAISTLEQMGDQYFSDPRMNNPSLNPYYPNFPTSGYLTIGSFDNTLYDGMRLTARLDGFTVSDVKNALDRAKKAYLLPGNSSPYVILDDSTTAVGGDRIDSLISVLNDASRPYIYDSGSTDAITTAGRPIIGYVSHGTNDGTGGLSSGYITTQLAFTLANGALFHTHESYNAYSFVSGGNHSGQGLVAEWLAIGGTAGIGNVEEPKSGTNYEANEDQFYKMMLNGYTWAEAAWSSITQLSYVQTVVGDPLMTFKVVLAGDANLDGLVGSGDMALLSANWGKTGLAGGYMWKKGDFNGDGLVGSADMSLLGANWGKKSSWYGSGSLASSSTYDVNHLVKAIYCIPKPSTSSLVVTGVYILQCDVAKNRFSFDTISFLMPPKSDRRSFSPGSLLDKLGVYGRIVNCYFSSSAKTVGKGTTS